MIKLNRAIQIALLVTLLFVIVFLYSKVSHLFTSFFSLIQIIFVPILLAAFFFYLLRPVIGFMMKYRIKRIVSILLVFLVFSAIVVWFVLAMLPMLQRQFISLIENAPHFFDTIGKQINELLENETIKSIFPAADFDWSTVSNYINKGLSSVNAYIGSLVSFVSNFTIVLFITPIILFFLLKEGEKLPARIVNGTPNRFKDDVKEMLGDFDKVLSNFIVGRVLVNLALGVLMYIGFVIIDLPYALLLTTIAVFANFIPFVGAILSSVPIVIVALVDSPSKAIWSLVIILAAQQIQDNLIAPYIFGKQLNIHPLTTIILVLGAGKMGGIIAMIIVIPAYLILKVIAIKVYQLFMKEKWEKL
ncbi:AI-2E family transporter [Paenibacillus montaniterrae]|uniref:AI-2E family transporter n=1 Tax=Paenibacillus montaniterrae TaxID=429341 RepID=A0A920CV95_9BACL|nr:AI-2E family transporter [Paenibacillus montaniterrae]GIP14766.1 AI-2E family transporter [Paenibacillus montaniterrae]